METESHVDACQVHNVYTNYEINAITHMIRNRKAKQILSIYTKEDSYQRVYIGRHSVYYHRVIITLHFIPNLDPEKFAEVNHKNHITNDNRVENFEWTTLCTNR